MNFFIDISDKRNKYIASELIKMGHIANSIDFENNTYANTENKDTGKDIFIFSPAKKFTLDEAEKISQNSIVFGGNLKDEIKLIFDKKNISYINIMNDESFVIKNAKITAEGVLALLINSTEKSIYENKILILGSGRVGLAIASLFNKLNLLTDLAIFHNDKLAVASFYCNNVIFQNELENVLEKYDVIINTVPSEILRKNHLEKIKENSVILEIASVNCLDKNLLNDFKIKYILAPALPQVYSTESAAKIMLECIMKQFKKLNVFNKYKQYKNN